MKILYMMPVTVSGGGHGASEMKRRQAILQQWATADCRVTVSGQSVEQQNRLSATAKAPALAYGSKALNVWSMHPTASMSAWQTRLRSRTIFRSRNLKSWLSASMAASSATG